MKNVNALILCLNFDLVSVDCKFVLNDGVLERCNLFFVFEFRMLQRMIFHLHRFYMFLQLTVNLADILEIGFILHLRYQLKQTLIKLRILL